MLPVAGGTGVLAADSSWASPPRKTLSWGSWDACIRPGWSDVFSVRPARTYPTASSPTPPGFEILVCRIIILQLQRLIGEKDG